MFSLILLVALYGSSFGERALPLSSFQYPSAPLLPIAPIVEYRDVVPRVANPKISNVQPYIVRNDIFSTDFRGLSVPDPCNPTPCGANTYCKRKTGDRSHVAECHCNPGYAPDGHTINGCKLITGCSSDSSCARDERCQNRKCVKYCPLNYCGFNAECSFRNGGPICHCKAGYTGNPNTNCQSIPVTVHDAPPSPPPPPLPHFDDFVGISPIDPCATNPCGHNAECRSEGNRAVCACLTRHDGDPLVRCNRYQCDYADDCGHPNQVCYERQCMNPCNIPNLCGPNTRCESKDRQPICSCIEDYAGDPLSKLGCTPFDYATLCSPSPCGLNTDCVVRDKRAVCSCKSNFFGDPLTGCKRECTVDRDCHNPERACVNYRCVNPCSQGACGNGANCKVQNYKAVCSCPEHYLGNAYHRCYPECTQHEDCRYNQVCDLFKCTNPCLKDCGENADCRVDGRNAVCSCPKGYTGNPYEYCRKFHPEELCTPNPCGINADCNPGFDRQGNDRPVCTCPRGYIGDPLVKCTRGDCQENRDCRSNQACYNYNCQDTCRYDGKSVCGVNARCNMINHRPVCSCPDGYNGNPIHSCNYTPRSSLRYVVGKSKRNYRW